MKGTTLHILALLAAAASGAANAHARLAELEVFDRTEGRRLAVHWHQGKAWIEGRPGNEYQVTVRNRGAGELLAVVSVDGINVVTGESASVHQSGYVLSGWRALDIRGWRKSLAETAAFYFTALPDSYAARTGRPDDVGVIGVALFRKKSPPAPVAPSAPLSRGEPRDRAHAPAAAEPRSSEEAAAAGSAGKQYDEAERLGTGHGRREASPARYVSFERASSTPDQVITLYYDSRRNLVARGVLREALPVAPVPRPFPGFVPDPGPGFVQPPHG
jgi:hypothetical protein